MRTMRTNLLLGLGALALLAGPVAAQSPTTDARWLPWLGCWHADGAPADAGLLCVRPATEKSSVEVLRIQGTDVASREVVWADGARHETSREGCDGWEKGAFSQDGERIFLNSNHTCEGGVVRDGGGIMTMVSPTEWLDVRYVGMGDDHTPWVQRYRAASDEDARAAGMADVVADRAWSVRTARMRAASPPSVDDIIEASDQEPSEVVEAWVAERHAPLDVNAKELTRMADAGVAPEVIDVSVAVSFPSHFQVMSQRAQAESSEAEDRAATRPYPGTFGYGYDPFFYRYGYSPYGYSPYGYGYGYGYGSGYGYGYGPYGYGGYTPVIVISTPSTTTRHGRVIPGRGYSRGSSGSTGSSAGAARAPTSGSAGATSSGSSGSSSSGRTAHRRGGGGGGGR